jgi:hypothetical protein
VTDKGKHSSLLQYETAIIIALKCLIVRAPGTLSTKKPVNIVMLTQDNVPALKIDRKKFVRFLLTHYHHL